MTYKERERQLCNNCEAKENCSYISRNLESKCISQQAIMYGWELGWQDAVDKACEWLANNLLHYWGQINANDTDEFIGDFKKYIEQQ